MRRDAKPAKAKVEAKLPSARSSPKNEGSKVRDLEKRLAEAQEQQAATAEILRVISQSPTDVQPVFDAVAENAARLCEAFDASIYRREVDRLLLVAKHGPLPVGPVGEFSLSLVRGTGAGRAVLDGRTVHVADMQNEANEFPESTENARRTGFRTILVVPLMREGAAIGTINLRRTEVQPFTERQVALLQTFADQAVIAIENVRLFTELQQKNQALTQAHAQVSETLEQQTATAEILRVISSSPTDVQPVFDVIAQSAARLCDGYFTTVVVSDGERLHLRATHNLPPEWRRDAQEAYPAPLAGDLQAARAVRERRVVHVLDMQEDPDVSPVSRRRAQIAGYRSWIGVPMLGSGGAVGTIAVSRRERKAFSENEIALLQTFADQAVIAIENVRLFNETKEALEQQTATSQILRVIASSPTDLQPVLDSVAETAARLCEAKDATIRLPDGDGLQVRAHFGPIQISPRLPISRDSVGGRAMIDCQTFHVHDLSAPEHETEFPAGRATARRDGVKTFLATPLLREGAAIGVINVRRAEVRPFSEKHVALLQTFADQAVIAIENVRLFKELQARTGELTQSVEKLTALGEVSRAVSSTLDVETVLDTIVSRASQLAGADGCSIYEYDEGAEQFELRATHNYDAEFVEAIRAAPLRKGEGLMGRAAEMREPIQIPDITQPGAYQSSVRDTLTRFGYRALLSVPLLREDQIIGSLSFNRKAPGEFPPEVVEVLKTFATQSALAIQNARLFREIEQKSRQLEAASRHKSEFLASMSHELRTPLNAIIGFSEVLTERMFGELNEKQEEYLKDIYGSGTHLLSLINDILDLSKIEAGRMELELTDFDLPTALDGALTLVRERAGRRGITLESTVDARLGEVRADERKIRQVVLNLLSNAIKFTPEGGRIEVGAVPKDGSVEVSVRDTGVGIAPEDQEAVFEEFRQVGTAEKKAEGTGLGLTLCRKFVELHGGRIGVKSQIGAGSTFTFTIPVRRGE